MSRRTVQVRRDFNYIILMPRGIYKRIKGVNYFPDKVGFQKGHKDIVPIEARKRAGKKVSERLKGNQNTKGKHWKMSEKGKINIGNSQRGKKKSVAFRKKLSESLKGCKSHRWKGGSSLQPGNKSLEWKLWRETVFARDNWTCQRCQLKGKLHPHHIQNFAQYSKLRFVIDNGITFCKKCHMNFHKIYGTRNNTKKQVKEFILQRTKDK
jgi:hypothetical protein